MNVILTIFVAGIIIFILWFLIVLRAGIGAAEETGRDRNDAGNDRP